MEWQPIDSAPEGVAVLAYWFAQYPGGKDVMDVATRHGTFWHGPEDFEDSDDYCEPQFWMPLPEPPK